MKILPSETVLKKNTQKADAKETNIVRVVASSLSEEHNGNEGRGREAKHG